ncbi:MAG: metallophosphoesterase, partial [Gammaproteobacteria bacterium]|nr:metallophosphoesterase [Gemmatimonadota bacterium]NIR34780.1 metallophosphoesterase [Actinomycetota bacterium]NIU72352.1 metallophosphoesterase [Gammaproteobacteria bacterium]NIX18609.1 metallophosphoesterase [Actinomycetota bacterium]
MRVAALYDIHGNLPALEAVLRDVAGEEVDLVLVGGDVVPGPMSAPCLERLLESSVPARFIQGNGEVDTLAFRDGRVPTRVPQALHRGMRWVADSLG